MHIIIQLYKIYLPRPGRERKNKEGYEMRKAIKTALITGIGAAMLIGLSGCGSNQSPVSAPAIQKSQQTPIAQPFSKLQEASDQYLKQNKMLTVNPQDIYDKVVINSDTSYVLIDVRSAEHYANAHIPGSIHVNYGDAWREEKTAYLPKDKKIVVVDYSGHAASQVAALWNMLGYDAVAMKNGMAGWSKNREIIGGSPMPCDTLNYPVVQAAAPSASYDLPVMDAKATTVSELVAIQSKGASEKPVVIQAAELNEKLTGGSYYIVDLRDPVHYQAGHIAGAVNIPFRSLAEQDNLKKIPTDKQVVMVCYDGHASSQAARIVNQLGYNAVALRDGMSLWANDAKVIGGSVIACAHVPENPIAKLNAVLKAAPGGAAT